MPGKPDHIFKRRLFSVNKCAQFGCELTHDEHAPMESFPDKDLPGYNHTLLELAPGTGWAIPQSMYNGAMPMSMAEAMAVVMYHLHLPVLEEEFNKTPGRAAEWFQQFARVPDYDNEMDQFLSVDFETTHSELVWESGLSFVALCPHHLLPYSGTASIGYIPQSRVVGISKLARALQYWTGYPVKQEDATSNIADALMKYVAPQGCMVVLRAQHTCMGLRGVKQGNHQTGTSAVRGIFANNDHGCKEEFLRLANP